MPWSALVPAPELVGELAQLGTGRDALAELERIIGALARSWALVAALAWLIAEVRRVRQRFDRHLDSVERELAQIAGHLAQLAARPGPPPADANPRPSASPTPEP